MENNLPNGTEEEVSEVKMDSVNLGVITFEDDDSEDSDTKKSSLPKKISNTTPLEMPSGELVLEDDDNGAEEVFSSSEKIRLFSDKIVSCVVGDKPIRTYALNRLFSTTNPRLFRDENYIILQVLYNYRDRVKRLLIDDEFLKLYLYRNRGILDKAKSYIDIHAYGEVDGQEDLGYIAGVIKHFKRLCGMPDISEAEFESTFEKYAIEFKAVETANIYAMGNAILTDGVTFGRKRLIGSEDSFNYIKRQMAEIEGLINKNSGDGFTTMNEIILEEKAEDKEIEKIGDFDNLTALNKVYGGIYTGTFYQVLAPLKSGKSKLCARICHTVSVKYGNNVTVWAAEGGSKAWTAQMRAIHFDYTYNTDVDVRSRKFGVSQDVILKNQFPSKELEDLELSSKLDLASNPDYGVVDYIDTPFNVETFLDDIDTSVKSNNSKIVIIDYVQIIGSTTNMSERERVSDAYKRLLAYCRKNNVAIFTPGQYKQETMNQLLGMNDATSADLRTSGGTSSEVLRTPDIIFALWASTQDLMNNSMKIMSMPCRFNKAYAPIPCYIDLEVCDFISLDENN